MQVCLEMLNNEIAQSIVDILLKKKIHFEMQRKCVMAI